MGAGDRESEEGEPWGGVGGRTEGKERIWGACQRLQMKIDNGEQKGRVSERMGGAEEGSVICKHVLRGD